MLRFLMIGILGIWIVACQPTAAVSEKRSNGGNPTASAADDTATNTDPSTAPIHLPSQDKIQSKGFKMPGVRPAEVCMEKGFTWLYQGYLKPECGTCHYKENRYGVTPFAQGEDEAASFAILKNVTDSKKLLEAVLGNVFCKSCVITKEDPLYADLEYFTLHMGQCDKPN